MKICPLDKEEADQLYRLIELCSNGSVEADREYDSLISETSTLVVIILTQWQQKEFATL